MTTMIDLQQRIASLRAPDGRGCPGGPRCDHDILALLDALEATTMLGEVLKIATIVTLTAENGRLERELGRAERVLGRTRDDT